MPFREYLQGHQAFVFEMDNVLYPQKDYLLQVYYLFAQFMEYTELLNAAEVLKVMQEEYAINGAEKVFEATVVAYPVVETYRKNYEGLHENARLPLKLLMFDNLLRFLQEIVVQRKQIILFTQGNVMQQLNKIRQTEWNGLEQYLTVYFAEEVGDKPGTTGIEFIANQHQLNRKDMLMIGHTETDRQCAEDAAIKFLQVDKLLVT
jgi:phosphoglycolate phosphatase-like HAD superfamily hydrolase